MSKKLAHLLSRSEDELAKVVSKLEAACGYPSEDVRLLSENKLKLRTKIEQLGLDDDDTTDEELYFALRGRFENDSQIINKTLGVNQDTKLEERIEKAILLVNHCTSVDEMWVLKKSVAKAALLKNPPKQVAKKLHYRSVASMLKREDIVEIYLAAASIESATWQKSLSKRLSKLNGSQYELRPVRIINLPKERWGGGSDPHIVSNTHIGALAIWPSDSLSGASVLGLTLLLLEGLERLNPSGYSEALHELSPALRWWADSGHLISDGKQRVSLNLKDVAYNHLRSHELKDAVSHHGARSLWSELTARYQQISSNVSNTIPDISYNFAQARPAKLPTSADLAEDYVKAE